MSEQSPVLVVTRPAHFDRTFLTWFKALVEGAPGTVLDYEFHLLQASAETARTVQSAGTQVTLGYVLRGASQGEPVVLVRDAKVCGAGIEGGRCSLTLSLMRRAAYSPPFVPVPLGGMRAFVVPKLRRHWENTRGLPRWMRRLALWLFTHTGWVWCLRLIGEDEGSD
jgi:hypothetical protein